MLCMMDGCSTKPSPHLEDDGSVRERGDAAQVGGGEVLRYGAGTGRDLKYSRENAGKRCQSSGSICS